ncbi:MAG: excinuclease ABC subunit UvrA, partial [Patescibacteria group bacterium]
THNLKNITVEMPRNKMVVMTGISGSGKSSLAFDTIFAEGQRRYVESLSAYARQFLNQMQKPDVDEIIGLSPAISIDQKSRSNNPRSTVATITEIYDYLRILYARIGRPHCLICDREIKKLSQDEILQTILDSVTTSKRPKDKVMGVAYDKAKLRILSPVVVGRKGEYYQMLYDLLGKGYATVRVDGKDHKLREQIILTKTKKHNIDVVVDEIYLSELADTKKSGAARERLSEAVEKALQESGGLLRLISPEGERLISAKFMCPYDGFSFPEIEPRLFSFNSPYGACPTCNGLGTKYLFGDETCDACKGARLRPEALNVFLGTGDKRQNIVNFTALSIKKSADFVNELPLTPTEKQIAKVILKEIGNRLQFMLDVGLDYLTLDRRAHTLSGGESQRIRLASQLGSGLVGALYVLDEPTIGLHSRDNARLIETLVRLRDAGNTIIVVEHDEDTIFSSDYLIDIGPRAGIHGGQVVVADDLEKLLTAKKNDSGSLTLAYLRGEKSVPMPDERRTQDRGYIRVRGGKAFNVENLDVDIPLGRLILVTGVSGSGKSTFLYEILHRNLQGRFEKRYRTNQIYNAGSISGLEYVSRAVLIDQSPIGRTPRSNPATYTGAWTFIRDMFAASEEARARGWGASRFSFNVKGGRCEACEGNGEIAVEMHFLPTVYVPCDICGGKRFTKETLEVKIGTRARPNDRSSGRAGKNIYEILRMTVEEALEFFKDIPAIHDRLLSMNEVGLGYLELGQSSTTLSGGEAQRVKISSELYRAHLQKTIYLLDEPTIGLHYEDVAKLIEILQKLVNKGNTVMVIEHNMDVIKNADYIFDFGPEGGVGGGKVIAKGTPEEVANNKKSYTGQYLKKVLK